MPMTPFERAKKFARDEPVETQFVKDIAKLIQRAENDLLTELATMILTRAEDGDSAVRHEREKISGLILNRRTL